MPTIVRSHTGKCKLEFDFSMELEADFQLQLRSDGYIGISVSSPLTATTARIMKEHLERRLIWCSLTGTLTGPAGKITIKKLVLNGTNPHGNTQSSSITLDLMCAGNAEIEYSEISQQTVEVHFGLTNFDFMGCEYTTELNTIRADKFRAGLEGMEVIFKQINNHQNIISELAINHDVALTAEAITTISIADLPQLEGLVDDVILLLSFATGTVMSWIYQDVYLNDKLIKSVLHSTVTGPFVDRNWVIDPRNLEDCDLRIFLETCYPAFKTLKSDLGLNVVLDFLVVAEQGKYSEVKFLLDSVAAECLLSYLPSYFRKIGKTGNLKSFKSKMKELLNQFGIVFSESELDFIKTRDKIVHTGKFPVGVDPIEATRMLHNLMDRITLTIFGYRGRFYVNHANRYNREALP